MRIGRRKFIGGTTMLVSSALVARSVDAATDSATQNKAPSVQPFFETRGARSANPAVATEALAAHCVNVKYSDLDATTLRKAKHRILDLIGCVIGGAPAEGNAALVDVVRSEAGPAEASVIGYPLKASASQAAMINATLARSYDFEVQGVVVGNKYVGSHNSPTTSMTALALSERGALPGKDFIAALVVGDDIAARMLATSGLDFSLGWDGAAIYPAIPAAAIASRLMGLTAQQAQDAFGITLDTICGTNQKEWDSATDWKFQQGHAARNAIFSAQLAKRGWVGAGDALLSGYGFFRQFTSGAQHPEMLTDDLGKKFYGEEYFKPYPSCGASHTSIECALAMRDNNKLSPSQIERVIVRLPPPSMTSTLVQPFTQRRYMHCQAIFSIHFLVTNTLLHGILRQEHFAEQAFKEPALISLLDRVSLTSMPEGKSGIEIEVLTKSGKTLLERHSGTPSRHPFLHPSSYEEIVAKFRQQVAFSGFVSKATADEIIQRVDNIEKESNMADFVKLLTRSYLT